MKIGILPPALLLLASACTNAGPYYDRCDVEAVYPAIPPVVAADRAFEPGASGNGSFGLWKVGPYGLPEYAYTLNQDADDRALWPNTEQRFRRDHGHLVGNLRLNALFYNEGYAEVYVQDRGHEALTRVDEARGNYGAAWSLLVEEPDDEDARSAWSSAWRWRPENTRFGRTFGMGYARYTACNGYVQVTRTLWAPEGTEGFLVSDIEVRNLTDKPRTVDHYEVWDVNRHYLQQQQMRSGTIYPDLPAVTDEMRVRLNEKFETGGKVMADHARIRNRLRAPVEVAEDEPAGENLLPPDVWLASLSNGDRFYTDGASFFGSDGPRDPALKLRQLAPGDAEEQAGALLAGQRLELGAGASTQLRYAFGAVPPDADLPDLSEYRLERQHEAFVRSVTATADRLVYAEVPDEAVPEGEVDAASLRREMAWHAWYLRNLGGYQEYFEHYVVNQGSAYWYLHGLDGAVRDFIFSAVALTYIDPWLARETLLYAARMRFESTKALAYTTGSYGQISAAIIHNKPSDLDLFLLWGLAEYVAATGDTSILASEEPFWPKHESEKRTVTEHIRTGVRYLRDVIGTGPNGLIKLGSGDWDDSITFFAESAAQAKQEGESVANSAMAAFIAPIAAALLPEGDPVADELRLMGDEQKARTAAQWNGDWYRRAWFGAGKPFGDDEIFLFTSALPMIADIPDENQARVLLDHVYNYLEKDSTTSAYQFWYLSPPEGTIAGVTDPGASNPVISGLYVWGAAHYDPAQAWRALLRNTMARKADMYPDIWYGIWSGPDSQYTSIHPEAGHSWASPATPQRDFPILNSNAHNGPLIGLIRVFGLEAAARENEGGKLVPALHIQPRVPAGQSIRIDLPLAALRVEDGAYEGTYRPIADTTMHFLFGPPTGRTKLTSVTIGEETHDYPAGVTEALLSVDVTKDMPLGFTVR